MGDLLLEFFLLSVQLLGALLGLRFSILLLLQALGHSQSSAHQSGASTGAPLVAVRLTSFRVLLCFSSSEFLSSKSSRAL